MFPSHDRGWVRKLHWANISGKYKRSLDDWKALCASCHKLFDGHTKIPLSRVKEIKIRHKNGENQYRLADEFGVNQSVISELVNDKIKVYQT